MTQNLNQSINYTSTTTTNHGSIVEGAAITGVIAAGAEWALGEWIGGVNNTRDPLNGNIIDSPAPNLSSGSYANSKVGVNVVQDNGKWYLEDLNSDGIRNEVSSLYAHTIGSENPAFKLLNTVPGFESGTQFHDAISTGASLPYKVITIAPAFAANYCATAPGLCAAGIDSVLINK